MLFLLCYHVIPWQQIYHTTKKYVDARGIELYMIILSLYNGLADAITLQLGVGATIDELEIKYIISEWWQPINIHNDIGVRVFLNHKKVIVDFFIKYSFCLTLKNQTNG